MDAAGPTEPSPGEASPREPAHWVVGSGGLLGSAVARRLGMLGHVVRTSRVPWADPAAAVATLLDDARSLDGDWRLWWCAGAGVVGSTAVALEAEVAVLSGFLAGWAPSGQGALFLASSAGGVYAGSSDPPFTEETEPVPISPYGRSKLESEAVVHTFAERAGVPVLVGRLANLYGPGQRLGKGQGLVSQLCLACLTRRPVSVYVPLDTRRDYLFVDDAAAMAVAGLEAVAERGGRHTKVLASGRSSTVGAILGDLRRITRRTPLVVPAASPDARQQAQGQATDLRLRSTAWPPLSGHARTTLGAGIAATLRAVSGHVTSSQAGP